MSSVVEQTAQVLSDEGIPRSKKRRAGRPGGRPRPTSLIGVPNRATADGQPRRTRASSASRDAA